MTLNRANRLEKDFGDRFDFWWADRDRSGTDLVEVHYGLAGTKKQLGLDEDDVDDEEEGPEPQKIRTPAVAAPNAGRERRGQVIMPLPGRK